VPPLAVRSCGRRAARGRRRTGACRQRCQIVVRRGSRTQPFPPQRHSERGFSVYGCGDGAAESPGRGASVLDELGRDGRERRLRGDAEFVVQQLADHEFGGAAPRWDACRSRAAAVILVRSEFRHTNAWVSGIRAPHSFIQPIASDNAPARHRVVFLEPGGKAGACHRLQSKRGHCGDPGQVFLQGEERALQRKCRRSSWVDLDKEPGRR